MCVPLLPAWLGLPVLNGSVLEVIFLNNHLVARFAAIYAGLALFVVFAGAAAYKAYTLPIVKSQATIVRKADLGELSVVRIAEQAVEQQASGSGILVKSEKPISVKRIRTGAIVTIEAQLVDPAGKAHKARLQVDLAKSLYSVSNVSLLTTT